MDTANMIASMNLPEPKPKKGYSTPELFDIGSAAKLIQGMMGSLPYRDCSNNYTTNFPYPCD